MVKLAMVKPQVINICRYCSVACDPSVVGVEVRRISRNYVRVNQPLVAQRYNQHYKSIDLLDQYLSAYQDRNNPNLTCCVWQDCISVKYMNGF